MKFGAFRGHRASIAAVIPGAEYGRRCPVPDHSGNKGIGEWRLIRTRFTLTTVGVNRCDVAQITYAQNGEDVRLWKALRDEPERFYVDIGAGHPVENSVTKLFSGRGWRGVNVEPGPNFELLETDRRADINDRAAITARDGVAPFYVTQPYPDPELPRS